MREGKKINWGQVVSKIGEGGRKKESSKIEAPTLFIFLVLRCHLATFRRTRRFHALPALPSRFCHVPWPSYSLGNTCGTHGLLHRLVEDVKHTACLPARSPGHSCGSGTSLGLSAALHTPGKTQQHQSEPLPWRDTERASQTGRALSLWLQFSQLCVCVCAPHFLRLLTSCFTPFPICLPIFTH